MAEDRLPSIDKLSTSNWPIWKMQITNFLTARKLWKLCIGNDPAPVRGENETVVAFDGREEDYTVKKARVMSVLGQTISTQYMYLIASHEVTSPQQAWNALLGHFERPSMSNKMALKCRLFGFKMDPSATMDSALKDLNELVERLAALGAPVNEQDQVALLLRSLPPSYSTLVTAYIAKGEVQMGELREALINHEQRLRDESSTPVSDSDSVLVSASGIQKKGSSGSCYGCGETGHYQRDCPVNPYKKSSMHGRGQGRGRRWRGGQAQQVDYASAAGDHGAFTAVYGVKLKCDTWVVDSGATRHMTFNRDLLYDYSVLSSPECVSVANGTMCNALGVGTVILNVQCYSKIVKCVLNNVLYVPNVKSNFYSVNAATREGNVVKFFGNRCEIHGKSRQLMSTGYLRNQMYVLDCQNPSTESTTHTVNAVECESPLLNLWHRRLGHCGIEKLKTAIEKKLVQGVEFPVKQLYGVKLSKCEDCSTANKKMMMKPSQQAPGEIRSKKKLELVHISVCGPVNVESLGGAKYFVTFIDDYSRCCQVRFMKNKSDVLTNFKEFVKDVSTECDNVIKCLSTDNGNEYTSREVENYLKEEGIKHDVTVPNVVAERMNHVLQTMVLAQLSNVCLPEEFWAEAVASSVHVHNRMPVANTHNTPFECWYGKKPNVGHIRVFGCVIALKSVEKCHEKLRYLGYAGGGGYRLLKEEQHKVVIQRDVSFNETDFILSVHYPGGDDVDPVDDRKMIMEPVRQALPPAVDKVSDEEDVDEDFGFGLFAEPSGSHLRSGSRGCGGNVVPASDIRESPHAKKKPFQHKLYSAYHVKWSLMGNRNMDA